MSSVFSEEIFCECADLVKLYDESTDLNIKKEIVSMIYDNYNLYNNRYKIQPNIVKIIVKIMLCLEGYETFQFMYICYDKVLKSYMCKKDITRIYQDSYYELYCLENVNGSCYYLDKTLYSFFKD
jgi:hypothetical protein